MANTNRDFPGLLQGKDNKKDYLKNTLLHYMGIRNPEIRNRFYGLLSRLKILYSSAGIYIYSLF